MLYRFSILAVNLKQRFLTMNSFKKESSTSRTVDVEEVALISTRIYIVLLITSMFVLALFNGFSQVTASQTVSSPSLAMFEQLQSAYSPTLSCPCQEIVVPYSAYLSIGTTYHQVRHTRLQCDIESRWKRKHITRLSHSTTHFSPYAVEMKT